MSLFKIDRACVFPFGRIANTRENALFWNLSWIIDDKVISGKREAWAIVGSRQSQNARGLVSTLLGYHVRISPPHAAQWPLQNPHKAAYMQVSFHEMKQRDDAFVAAGSFTDPSARYHHLRGQDRKTLRDVLAEKTGLQQGIWNDVYINKALTLLRLETLLDRSYSALSNGQTRRARILQALMQKPEVLLLEEPFTGLDAKSRGLLQECLGDLHASQSPRIVTTLRPQDPVPDYVTHVALCGDAKGDVIFGDKETVWQSEKAEHWRSARTVYEERAKEAESKWSAAKNATDKSHAMTPVVRLSDVTVQYPSMKALDAITWNIYPGDRWVLSGHNGSGKSTLLAVLVGDHPQSFRADYEFLGKKRRQMATVQLQTEIGISSPEIFAAFPRRLGEAALTGRDVIITGFYAVYSYRKASERDEAMLKELLDAFALPGLNELLDTPFAEMTPGSQMLMIVLRALVSRPRLVILDEPYVGLDLAAVDALNKYIDHHLEAHQALILVSHFVQEWPRSMNGVAELVEGVLTRCDTV